jgi:hypothetical protein
LETNFGSISANPLERFDGAASKSLALVTAAMTHVLLWGGRSKSSQQNQSKGEQQQQSTPHKINVFHRAKRGNEHHDNNKIRERNERVRRHEKTTGKLVKMEKPEESLSDRAQDCRALPAATADERKIKTARPQHDLHFPLAFFFFLLFCFDVVSFLSRDDQMKEGIHCVFSSTLFFIFQQKEGTDGRMDYERVDEERRLSIDTSLIAL